MTAGRTYLSIGDVLTLLRQEFPDVTISKIRFLESQGLVNPERTPSGYRKFYDHDVERLRWVLRQQREHFLPLKVIKGRLEDETQTSDSQASSGNGRRSSEAGSRGVTQVAGSPRDADVGEHPSRRSTAVGLEDRGPKDRGSKEKGPNETGPEDVGREIPDHLPGFDPPGGQDLLERHLSGQQPRSAGSGPSGSAPSGSAPSRPLGATTTGNAARAAGQGPPVPDRDRTFGGGLKAPWAGTVGAHEPANSQDAWHPSSSSAARSGAHEGHVPEKAQNEPAARPSDSGRTPRAGAGRFTVAEIAAAAGLTESAIEELDSYGILSSRNVGGIVHFDESELTIARVAAEFAQFGIEPRHLRLYKHASEREAGFVEQLVLPLLKQRNPEARKRATEMVADLTRLGEGLRMAMVARSLQDLLGGVTPKARVVHTRAEVDAAFERLGAEFEAAYPDGALLVAVQKGSILVLADLIRSINVDCEVDFLSVSDYAGGSGRARIVQDLATDVHDRDVVLVEDIVDTGLTCEYVLQTLRGRGPRSLAVLALLDRRARRIVPVPLRFVGFEATEELLIGRGLGVAGRYRNLDLIAATDASALERDRDAYVDQFYDDRVEQPTSR